VPDLLPLPASLPDRFARLGVDVDELLRRAQIPRSRFAVARPFGTTAELFALWRTVEECATSRDTGTSVQLGTTYQHVLDDVRRRSARRLLANTDLATSEVAFLLGFEEMNSFTRAFHAWEGTSPGKWRATAR